MILSSVKLRYQMRIPDAMNVKAFRGRAEDREMLALLRCLVFLQQL